MGLWINIRLVVSYLYWVYICGVLLVLFKDPEYKPTTHVLVESGPFPGLHWTKVNQTRKTHGILLMTKIQKLKQSAQWMIAAEKTEPNRTKSSSARKKGRQEHRFEFERWMASYPITHN